MGKRTGEISYIERARVQKSKKISSEDIGNMLLQIENNHGWKIMDMLKMIYDGRADFFSIKRQNPLTHLYIFSSPYAHYISITYEKNNKEISVEVDKDELKKVLSL